MKGTLDDGWPESVEDTEKQVTTCHIRHSQPSHKSNLKVFKHDTQSQACARIAKHATSLNSSQDTTLSQAGHTWSLLHTQLLLHTAAFTYRRFSTESLLHRHTFTHKPLYSKTLLHTNTFTKKPFHTHTHHSCFYKPFRPQSLLHADAFTHSDRHFCTQTLLHAHPFHTHKHAYTQTLLHADSLPHQHLYTNTSTHRCFYTNAFTRFPRPIQNLAFSWGGLPGKVAPTCPNMRLVAVEQLHKIENDALQVNMFLFCFCLHLWTFFLSCLAHSCDRRASVYMSPFRGGLSWVVASIHLITVDAGLLPGWCWDAAKWLPDITMGSVQTAAELLPDCF